MSNSVSRQPGHAAALPVAAQFHIQRRGLLALALLGATPWVHATQGTTIEVWKGPSCDCCGDWIKHLQAHGFAVQVHDTGNAGVRQKMGLPDKLGSCHTAVVGGYAIEGHVPARELQRLLRETPRAVGLAVPGMPFGTPGMDQPKHGGRRDPHDVLLVLRDGRTSVYQAYR